MHGDINAPDWTGALDTQSGAVLSAYAIQHVSDARKQALYGEIFTHLVPGSAFLRLGVIRPPNVPLQRASRLRHRLAHGDAGTPKRGGYLCGFEKTGDVFYLCAGP